MIKRLSIIFMFLVLLFISPPSVLASPLHFSWHWPVVTSVTLVSPVMPQRTSAVLGLSVDNVQAYIINQINQYRASLGLSPVQPGPQTCSFAAIRAKEIAIHFNHDGFTQRYNTHTLPYKAWTKATENLAETWDYQRVVMLWKNSPEHALNMRAATPYVCVVKYGNYYAYEGMKP